MPHLTEGFSGMTDIEAKALALVNHFSPYECDNIADANHLTLIKSLRQSIEREADTEYTRAAELREQAERFSEAIYAHFEDLVYCAKQGPLAPFIIPTLDPLTGALNEALGRAEDYNTSDAEDLRAAMQARGYEWRKIGESGE